MDIVLASSFVVFFWWMSTVVLLALTRKNSINNEIRTMILATIGLFVGFCLLDYSSKSPDVLSAYLGFISVIMIWAWQEAGFLVGWITGSRKIPCPKNTKGMHRAWLAFQTINYHELVLLILGGLIYLMTLESPNDTGFKTFLILWIMRLSAKINVFLGVRNFYEEFLPIKISYLTTYFKRKSFNPALPIILGITSVIDMLFWYHAGMSLNSYERVSLTILATLLGLAIIEHIFMMLPFQLDRIWRLGLLKRI